MSYPIRSGGMGRVRSGGMGAGVLEATNVVRKLYFGRDDAERDMSKGGLLRAGFQPTRAYEEALSGRKTLVIGRKGSGKSAICMQLASGEVRPGWTSLITPDTAAGDELRRFDLQGLTDQAAKSLIWRYVFAIQAARHLVTHGKDGHGVKSRSVGALRRFLKENGELKGERFSDRVLSAARGLQTSISLEAFGVKGSLDVKGQSEGTAASKRLDVIEDAVAKAFSDLDCAGKHEPFLVLVDQIEHVWSGDTDSKAMVKGLLLAGHHVGGPVYGGAVRCVLFLRADIYDSLKFGESDKFHGDEMRIDWAAGELSDVALARASASLGSSLTPDDLWTEVFPRQVTSESMPDYMFRRVLLRPRDVIQFLNQCRDQAAAHGHDRIEDADVVAATKLFSQWKLQDLSGEYQINYPFLEDLFVVFENSGYVVTRPSLESRLRDHGPALRRSYPDYQDAFSIHGVLDILYAIGFLGIKRAGGVTYSGGVQAGIQPSEQEFHIHPCFRPALNATRPMEIDPYANVGVQVGRVNYQINQTNAFNIRVGRDVKIGYSGDAYLFDFLVHSCERILRQLGRSEISAEMRDQVSEEISKVLKMAVERRQHPSEWGGAAADHVIKAAGFLDNLASRLDQNGLAGAPAGERLIRAIRDEASELISVVGGAPRG